MNKEYIEHEKAFHKNLDDFKQGVLDYFIQNTSSETDNDYYNQGVEFADKLNNTLKGG